MKTMIWMRPLRTQGVLRVTLRSLCVLRKTAVAAVMVVVFALGACSDWLKVSSRSEIVADELFSKSSGFQDALIGIYIKLAERTLYGENMTWKCVEILSQQYATNNNSEMSLYSYDYDGSRLKSYCNNIWIAQYNTIANINNILRWADRNSGVMHPVMDSIVRGECLALRAYLHFDLLRLYGKGDYANRPELANEQAIPYSKDFALFPPKGHTYKETFELLFADIEEALRYFEADPIKSYNPRYPERYSSVSNNGFIATSSSSRRYRMNYYACLGLYARALMWEGSPQSKAKALEIAQVVTNNGTSANTEWHSWAVASNFTATDYMDRNSSFTSEQLWTLYVDDLLAYQDLLSNNLARGWFDALSNSGVSTALYMTPARVYYVFEIESAGITSDWRHTMGLRAEGMANNYALVKYRERDPEDQRTRSSSVGSRMAMVRITELYYIAAECLADSDPVEATRYLNVVRNHRNIPTSLNLTGLTSEQVKEEVKKEYMKEFIAEGQLFFYYKRLGMRSIYGYEEEMGDSQYVFLVPDAEQVYGDM